MHNHHRGLLISWKVLYLEPLALLNYPELYDRNTENKAGKQRYEEKELRNKEKKQRKGKTEGKKTERKRDRHRVVDREGTEREVRSIP